MPEFKPPRPGEIAIELPETTDAGVHFIGRIRSPWPTPAECPKNVRERQEIGTVELDPRYAAGLKDLDLFSHAILLYWMDRSRRDLIVQSPSHLPGPRGVFAIRSPVRPNPIALSVVEILGIEGATVRFRAVDCADGTPLLDIKPYLPSIDSVPQARRP